MCRESRSRRAPPSIITAFRPSGYTRPSISTRRGSYAGQPGQDRRGLVDRVVAQPAAGGVGAAAGGLHAHPQRALAAAVHPAVGRLQQDGEVARQPVGVALDQAPQAVELGGDLLGVVEDEGQVAVGRRQRGGEPQLDGDARTSCRRCRSPTAGRRASSREGRLSAIGTVSRCPASTTRSARPSRVRATTASPSRSTVRCGSARSASSTRSASVLLLAGSPTGRPRAAR